MDILSFFNEYDDDDECEHTTQESVNGMMMCVACGMEIEPVFVTNDYPYSKTNFKKRSAHVDGSVSYECRLRGFGDYESDLADKKYNIIIQKAIEQGVPETHRGKPRRALICSCIFFAIMSQGKMSTTLAEIGKRFDITEQTKLCTGKEIYLKFFPEDNKIRQTPIDLIPNIMEKAGISIEYLPKIEGIANALKDRSRDLNASKPLSIAAAYTYIFLELNPTVREQVEIDNVKSFSNRVNMSVVTVERKSKSGLDILYKMQEEKERIRDARSLSARSQ